MEKMANADINMERFAHDVCVHVLEKFAIFKAPDDTRKQNKYTSYDFLPWVSRSVVSNSIWIRDSFKNALEDNYITADPADKEKIWNFFDDYFLQNDMFAGKDCTGKVCISLALCTEYIQFVSTKDFTVSLNKLVIRWSDFFEKNLRVNFDAEGGFSKLYSNIKSCQVDRLDNFHKAFISEYCLPYGARECTLELAKQCAEKHGIQLHVALFGVNTIDIIEDSSMKMSQEGAPSNLPESKDPKPGEIGSETSDSEDSSSSTETDSETSRNVGSEASDFEMSQNNLLGIPPHEEMLREIDPFFIENIPSPPKPRSTSKSPKRQPDSSSIPQLASKSPDDDPSSSESAISASKSEDSSDASESFSKSPEGESASNDGPQSASGTSELTVAPESASESPKDELGSNSAPESASKCLKCQPDSSVVHESASESPENEYGSSDGHRSASKSEGKPDSSVASESSSKSPKDESSSSDNPQSDPEQEELQEKVEQILSKMEHEMDALRALLFERGYLSIKAGRRGSRMRLKDSS